MTSKIGFSYLSAPDDRDPSPAEMGQKANEVAGAPCATNRFNVTARHSCRILDSGRRRTLPGAHHSPRWREPLKTKQGGVMAKRHSRPSAAYRYEHYDPFSVD
jgi:hypothetical protein